MTPPSALMTQADTMPPADALRAISRDLSARMEAGHFRRLPSDELVRLRAYEWALTTVAERLAEAPVDSIAVKPAWLAKLMWRIATWTRR